MKLSKAGVFIRHGCLLFLLAAGSAFAGIQPADLRCECKVNPPGLSETGPRLSWKDVGAVAGERGQYQTGYQIQVASSLQVLTNNQGDLWDTGQVMTNQTSQITYAGAALASHQVGYWHVQVWDKNGQPSGWSSPASWSMGILTQAEWTAQWIGRDDGPAWNTGSTFFNANWIWYPEGNPAVSAPVATRWFRKVFTVPAGVSVTQAIATMVGDNKFTLYVNGQIALCVENENFWQHHGQADISPFLVNGTNVLAVAVINDGSSPNPAGLIGAFDLAYGNGLTNSFQTDGTWIAANQLYSNWNQTNFVATGWTNAMVLGPYGIGPWNSFANTYLAATQVRKDFTLSQLPTRAILYVTGQGLVEPHLNGAKVGNDYFIPGWTDYAMRLYYRAYDVTALLQQGSNTLGAILGDGWYRGNCAFDGQNYYGTKTRLRAQLHMFYSGGTNQVIASDASWQAGFGPIRQGDNQAGETYDARLELPGWDSPGFSSLAWTGVTTGAEISPVIQAHPAEPVRTNQNFLPVSITQPQPGLYVFNFGQNISGWARLLVTNQPAGRRIVMRFGERLNPDGTVFRDNLRMALQMDTYICKGGGVETWEPRFTYHGFQYVEVQGLVQPPGTNTFTAVSVRSDVPDTGAFQCSNGLINQIYSNMLWSVRDNYFEVPTDCPQRSERAGWCDGIEIMGTGMFNQQAESFFSKWSQDIVDTKARATHSDFGDQAPLVGDDGLAAGWQDSVVFVPYYLYQTYGDLRPAQRFYTNMADHLNYYAAHSSGFVGPDTGYGDWVAVDGSTPKTLISTAFYARCASMMAEMAQALGRTSDAAAYRQLYTNICSAFQTNFVAADGTVGQDSQGGYALAFGLDLLTPAQRVLAKNKFVAAINAQSGHPSTGMVTTHFLLPALTGIGRNDLAYQMLAKTDYPSWGFEIGVGATTIFELWNSVNADGTVNISQDAMNSLNHANFGACAEWFYRGILGLDVLSPGFKKILIDPQPGGGLTSAQGHYDSVQGCISNSWTYAGNTFTMAVAIPPNTTAQICVPTTNAGAITESGLPAASASGVTYVGVSNGAAIYNVGSGNYVFSSPYSISTPTVTNFNFNFEMDTAAHGGVVATVPSGWTAFNKAGGADIGSQDAGGADYTVNNPLAAPASSNQYCYINMFNPNVTGGIYQDVGALQPNTIYTLTVAIGSRADRFNSPGNILLINGTDNTGTVLAGGGGIPVTQDTWQDYGVTFTNGTAASGDLTIVLSAIGNGTTIQADFDNVRLTTVPAIPKVPVFGLLKVSGANLILAGTNGTPNSAYTWLAATNLTAPVNWSTNSTGMLNGSGAFSNVIPINPAQPAGFFRLRMP
ncbi:MAG TPA: family 78 glycoside hydrolase catalytic domain [Candidatus Acidoferrales bacterium]|jgi:alpha-L-rhamnosidase|nr:family 78 glycoside hydrolase catalytic domain [Candidatus Acidoferrales bacterium]